MPDDNVTVFRTPGRTATKSDMSDDEIVEFALDAHVAFKGSFAHLRTTLETMSKSDFLAFRREINAEAFRSGDIDDTRAVMAVLETVAGVLTTREDFKPTTNGPAA